MADVFVKDPDAVLDYSWDWSSWLAALETISTRTVTVPTGIVLDSDSETAGAVTAWLSGGTAGEMYAVVCRIVTSQGRTDERSIRVHVRER